MGVLIGGWWFGSRERRTETNQQSHEQEDVRIILLNCRRIRRGNESTHVTFSPCTLSPREERRRVFGNEKVNNIGTSKMIILQQPRIGKSAELYTHMPSGTEWRNAKERVLGILCGRIFIKWPL